MLDTESILKEMYAEAGRAAREFADARFDGRDGGACGFAWITVFPTTKGNTKVGKNERTVLKSMGFRKDWTGKGYQIWDPANWPGQSIDVKEAGAIAAANVLRKYGFNVYVGSRLD
jgi:hypothetical protein